VILLFAHPSVKDLQEVTAKLGISFSTAETHRRHAYAKLGCSTKAELVPMSRDHGWK